MNARASSSVAISCSANGIGFSKTQKQQNAPLSDRVVSAVTITEPTHPLFGQTLPVIRIPASALIEPTIIVQLPNGEHRRLPQAATDLALAPRDRIVSTVPLLPISVRTLLPLAHAVRCLLEVREEKRDEHQPEPTAAAAGGALPGAANANSQRATTSLAPAATDSTPTTNPVPGRTDPASAPCRGNPSRGGNP